MAENKLIRRETGLLMKALRSEGFYEAAITNDNNNNTVLYSVDTGPLFRLESYSINQDQEDIQVPEAAELGLLNDMPLRAADILAAQESLERYLREHNCLWQISVEHEVHLDHMTRTAEVVFQIRPSEQVTISQINLQGLETVEEPYVRRTLKLQPGQCFRNTDIEKARLRLLQTGLFSLVDTESIPPQDGTVDIDFNLKERHHKTIKAGAGYSTDESISLLAGWEHRNFFGSAEKLEVDGKLSFLYRTLESTLTIPSFRAPDQVLILKGDFVDETLDAYDAIGFTMAATLKRRLVRHLAASGGIQYKFRSVQEDGNEDLFGMVSLPATLEYDSRDSILDPGKGWVASLKVQPFIDSFNTDILFLKTTLGASIYHTLSNMTWTPTLAARAVIGSINGTETGSIPADERFYSGGGGSVRGYPFQKLGPVENGDPLGGRSLLEVSMETRMHFTPNWGGVIFIDGGNVYDDSLPELTHQLRWAFGIGARYITTLAPIRLDIAFPINGRNGIDDSFQLYVSLAQAF